MYIKVVDWYGFFNDKYKPIHTISVNVRLKTIKCDKLKRNVFEETYTAQI